MAVHGWDEPAAEAACRCAGSRRFTTATAAHAAARILPPPLPHLLSCIVPEAGATVVEPGSADLL
eukprot:COSAG02_NODE_61750_length_267_cov_1.839286_1_plen_64_part_01